MSMKSLTSFFVSSSFALLCIQTSAENACADTVHFLQDGFSYVDGDLEGNSGWYNPTTVGTHTVVSGVVETPDASGEYVTEHLFSRVGHESAQYSLEIDAFSTRHNNAIAIVNPIGGNAIFNWNFVDTFELGTGWLFNGEQSGVTGEVRLQALVDPVNETVLGRVYEQNSGTLLFTSSSQFVESSRIADSNAVNIYGDSRGLVASDARWDNLSVSAAVSTVPEPNSLLGFCLATASFSFWRRRKNFG